MKDNTCAARVLKFEVSKHEKTLFLRGIFKR